MFDLQTQIPVQNEKAKIHYTVKYDSIGRLYRTGFSSFEFNLEVIQMVFFP